MTDRTSYPCAVCQTPFECRFDRLCDRPPLYPSERFDSVAAALTTYDAEGMAQRMRQDGHPPGRLLGLHGRAGVGKSTIARALFEDGSGAILHYASPIKAMGRAAGLTEAQVNGAEKDTPCALIGGVTPRRFLQQLSKHLRGTYGDDVVDGWTLVHVDRLLAHGLDVILDDVRLPSEAAAIWERQGVVIELTQRVPAKLLDNATASDALEQRLPDRWIHDTIPNRAQVATVAEAVRYCWHDTIACVGASRAW